MSTLVEFLLARIAEDEAAARAVAAENVGGAAVSLHLGDNAWDSEWPFADRFTPARVLTDAVARRQIVERHAQSAAFGCGICSEYRREHVETCEEMRMLAAVYADHPDYREEWRP